MAYYLRVLTFKFRIPECTLILLLSLAPFSAADFGTHLHSILQNYFFPLLLYPWLFHPLVLLDFLCELLCAWLLSYFVCRKTVSGCSQPPPSRVCCCVWLMWTPPWLWHSRLSVKPTGTDTQNCEYGTPDWTALQQSQQYKLLLENFLATQSTK